jgi:four helix bundle protein
VDGREEEDKKRLRRKDSQRRATVPASGRGRSNVLWGQRTLIFLMADFRKLLVWQKANTLSVATAEAVEMIRGHAGAILRSQLLRSTFSIQSNIAEGSSKKSDREFARYVRIALGSTTESANHLILLHDLRTIDDACFMSLSSKLDEIGKMLSGLDKALATKL